MTSDEIRKIPIYDVDVSTTWQINDCAMFLREIAAQIAQLNEGLESITQPGGPQINTGAREVSCKH